MKTHYQLTTAMCKGSVSSVFCSVVRRPVSAMRVTAGTLYMLQCTMHCSGISALAQNALSSN